MSLACDAEVRVENEHALRFSIVSKPVPLLEYIKAISSLVGASHILAIFEENESLKVFFDDKRFVDILIKSGIHVMGHHVRIDYVVPPGIKVILSSVDPVISNVDVVKILSEFGTVMSPCIRPPISDDTELCHIGYGVRYVYMSLNGGIPNKIEFKYGDQIYAVKARIEDKPTAFFAIPYIKTDDSDSNCDDMTALESLPGPSGVVNGVENSDPVHVEGSSHLQIESAISLKLTNKSKRGGRRGRPKKDLLVRRKRITATTQAARRIRKNVKQKFMSVRKNHHKENVKRVGRKPKKSNSASRANTSEIDTISLPSSENLDADMYDDIDKNSSLPYKPVVDTEKLNMYLDEVKRHRAPIELAKKYIGEDSDINSMLVFCSQLRDYNINHNDPNLRQRISRLIRCIKEAM